MADSCVAAASTGRRNLSFCPSASDWPALSVGTTSNVAERMIVLPLTTSSTIFVGVTVILSNTSSLSVLSVRGTSWLLFSLAMAAVISAESFTSLSVPLSIFITTTVVCGSAISTVIFFDSYFVPPSTALSTMNAPSPGVTVKSAVTPGAVVTVSVLPCGSDTSSVSFPVMVTEMSLPGTPAIAAVTELYLWPSEASTIDVTAVYTVPDSPDATVTDPFSMVVTTFASSNAIPFLFSVNACPSAVSVIVSSVAARSVTTAPFAAATASVRLA